VIEFVRRAHLNRAPAPSTVPEVFPRSVHGPS
jgi:hypothetical protein